MVLSLDIKNLRGETMEISNIMKALLKKQPNKSKLATELLISRGTVYNWLSGLKTPTSEGQIFQIKKVMKKYNIKL
jgi:DNA-binding transcriptional regulator YiaG